MTAIQFTYLERTPLLDRYKRFTRDSLSSLILPVTYRSYTSKKTNCSWQNLTNHTFDYDFFRQNRTLNRRLNRMSTHDVSVPWIKFTVGHLAFSFSFFFFSPNTGFFSVMFVFDNKFWDWHQFSAKLLGHFSVSLVKVRFCALTRTQQQSLLCKATLAALVVQKFKAVASFQAFIYLFLNF